MQVKELIAELNTRDPESFVIVLVDGVGHSANVIGTTIPSEVEVLLTTDMDL